MDKNDREIKLEGTQLKTPENPEKKPNRKFTIAAAMAMGLGMTHRIERNHVGRPCDIVPLTQGEKAEREKKKQKRKAASKARKRR